MSKVPKLLLRFCLGKCKLNSDPTNISEHWALGVVCIENGTEATELWFEVSGSSKQDANKTNKIVFHQESSKYEIIDLGERIFYGSVDDVKSNINNFNDHWLKTHPLYELNGDNCQMYVQNFAKHYNLKEINTQNNEIGNLIIKGGIIGTIIIVLIGLLVKGTH